MSGEERREELIAAAATGDLTAEEARELDAMTEVDPSLRAEIADLTGTAQRVAASGWREPEPFESTSRESGTNHRQALIAASVALVAGIGLGVGGAVLFQDDDGADDQASQETGPPGALGAHEPLELVDAEESSDAGSDVEDAALIEGVLVAHTWGTEAILDVEGLPTGATYEVVFVAADGASVSAGAFLGSEVPIHCAMNAAVLRENVRTLQILNQDGEVVRSADLPAVDD